MDMDVDETEFIGTPSKNVPRQEATDEHCMGKKLKKQGGEVVRDDEGRALFGGYCRAWPGKGTDHVGEGRCSKHGGNNSGENGQGGKKDNDNAATHRAYQKLAIRTLTEGEEKAFEEVAEKLEEPESAQEIARNAASYCLIMGHRSGDERWFRRYEGICDKFGIAPEDELTVHHEGLEDAFMSNLRNYHEEGN